MTMKPKAKKYHVRRVADMSQGHQAETNAVLAEQMQDASEDGFGEMNFRRSFPAAPTTEASGKGEEEDAPSPADDGASEAIESELAAIRA